MGAMGGRRIRGASKGADAGQLEIDFSRPLPAQASPAEGRIEDHARRIAGFLSITLPQAVDVVFNDNRATMISFKRVQGRIVVRLHRMFRHAGTSELAALALFLKSRDRGASSALDGFIASHRGEIDQKPRRRAPRGASAGAVHDLAPILERVRQRYFGGFGEVAICWSRERAPSPRRRGRSRSRSRALATYSFEDKAIRVSKVLDSPRVPEFVLEWIVYHEMLHHVLPAETSSGRRRFHTRRFRALEHAFERYEEARDWEKANLDWLLA
jgi:hypothetical protein